MTTEDNTRLVTRANENVRVMSKDGAQTILEVAQVPSSSVTNRIAGRTLIATDGVFTDDGTTLTAPGGGSGAVTAHTSAADPHGDRAYGEARLTVASMAALLALTPKQGAVQMLGYYAAGDGGGGGFYWDAASTAAHNAGTVILPTGHSGAGRWLRQWDGMFYSVRWFGAKGNGTYRDTTTGLVWQDQGFTVAATDDTAAFIAWVDAWRQLGGAVYDRTAGVNMGYWAKRPVMLMPPGGYYLTSPKIWDKTRVAVAGSEAGMVLQGAGKENTTLWYKEAGAGAQDFMISDRDAFPFMKLMDFSVHCNGTEKILDHYSTGTSQDVQIHNCRFLNYKACIAITGTGNADKMVLTGVQGYSLIAGSSFFSIIGNSQSIAHTLIGCNVYAGGAGSTALDVEAGGDMQITGGSWIATTGATLFKVYEALQNGALLGSQVRPTVFCSGVKAEIHDSAVFADVNQSGIVFKDAPLQTFPGNTGNHKVIVRRLGYVAFTNVNFGNVKVAFVVNDGSTYAQGLKHRITFDQCELPSDWLSTQIFQFNDDALATPYNGNNQAGQGRVIARNCRGQGVTYGAVPVVESHSGAPLASYGLGFDSESLQRVVTVSTAHPNTNAGLPSKTVTSTAASIKIPLNCNLLRIGIAKTGPAQAGSGATQSWDVKDGNGSVLATLTLAASTDIKSAVVDVVRRVQTTNDRTFTLTANAANTDHYAAGFFWIEHI